MCGKPAPSTTGDSLCSFDHAERSWPVVVGGGVGVVGPAGLRSNIDSTTVYPWFVHVSAYPLEETPHRAHTPLAPSLFRQLAATLGNTRETVSRCPQHTIRLWSLPRSSEIGIL